MEVMGRYSNRGEMASDLRNLLDMTPEPGPVIERREKQFHHRLRAEEVAQLIIEYKSGVKVRVGNASWATGTSSVPRRLAVAGVGLVPSPVGLGRDGIAIETARDEEFLCCANQVAFTEEVRGSAGCWVQVAQHLKHLCLIQPYERGRRPSSWCRTQLRAMTRHKEGGGGRARGEHFEQGEGGWHR